MILSVIIVTAFISFIGGYILGAVIARAKVDDEYQMLRLKYDELQKVLVKKENDYEEKSV